MFIIKEKTNLGKILILLIVATIVGGGTLGYCYWQIPKQTVPSIVFEKGDQKGKKVEEFDGRTILFVGDIMLDRGVKKLMKKNSVFYPFEKVRQFLGGIDIVVGNLEGPIVKDPPEFAGEYSRFAFSKEVVKGLSFANFNLLSLANNHTLNAGEKGFEETKKFLAEANISFVGQPIKCNKDFLFERDDIIFLAFNKAYPFDCSDGKIIEIVKETRSLNSKKFLVVMFHWGIEYQPEGSFSQQNLAHQVIDAGADLIIGSHPHVIQDIEKYKGKLIFYSLGNFIFDHYFSKETQRGLAVGLEIYPQKLIYKLFPIKSYLRSQPSLMKQKEAKGFLRELASRSSSQLFDQIEIGVIEIERQEKGI